MILYAISSTITEDVLETLLYTVSGKHGNNFQETIRIWRGDTTVDNVSTDVEAETIYVQFTTSQNFREVYSIKTIFIFETEASFGRENVIQTTNYTCYATFYGIMTHDDVCSYSVCGRFHYKSKRRQSFRVCPLKQNSLFDINLVSDVRVVQIEGAQNE